MVSKPIGRALVAGVGGLAGPALAMTSTHFLAVALAAKVTLTNEEARTAVATEKLNQNPLVHPIAIPLGNDQKLDNDSLLHQHLRRRESVP
jgi:hypothetical protein